jgi:SH3 domain-containing protein
MRYVMFGVVIWATAAAAMGAGMTNTYRPIVGSGSELSTTAKAVVRAEPKKTARALGAVPTNTKVRALGRKDFWFKISCEIDGRKVTGWVFFTEVTQGLGMSKGQLRERNAALSRELAELQEKLKKTDKDVEALRAQVAELARAREELAAQLEKAREKIKELERGLKTATPPATKGRGGKAE